MKPLSLALLFASAVPALGLAGCQTVENDRYVYSTTYGGVYETDYVYRDVYRDRVVVRRPPSPPPRVWYDPPVRRPPPPGPPPRWHRDDPRDPPPPRRPPDGPGGTDGPWYPRHTEH